MKTYTIVRDGTPVERGVALPDKFRKGSDRATLGFCLAFTEWVERHTKITGENSSHFTWDAVEEVGEFGPDYDERLDG